MKRKINAKMIQIRTKVIRIMADKRGEGFVDTAVKIFISVVIGAFLLAGLYALFNDSILTELQNSIHQMFSYSG